MIKQLLTVASFAAGSAGVLMLDHLNRTPLAFTSADDAQQIATSPASLVVEAPMAVDTEASLPPTAIKKAALVRRPAPPPEPTLEPCSQWGVVGAQFVTPSGATGIRSVRDLCNKRP